MNISEQIVGILINPFTSQINFSFPGVNGNQVKISGSDFLTVAVKIKMNAISIVEGTAKPGEAIYTAKNDGARNANTMYLGQNNYASKSFEALVVHESVHAIHDLQRAVIPWIDSEVAAYIAQGFYAQNAGVPDGHISSKEYIFLGKLMASDFVTNGQISDDWLAEIRDKLRNDPDYAPYINKTFFGDG